MLVFPLVRLNQEPEKTIDAICTSRPPRTRGRVERVERIESGWGEGGGLGGRREGPWKALQSISESVSQMSISAPRPPPSWSNVLFYLDAFPGYVVGFPICNLFWENGSALESGEQKKVLNTEISACRFVWFLRSPSRGHEPGRRNESDVCLVVR